MKYLFAFLLCFGMVAAGAAAEDGGIAPPATVTVWQRDIVVFRVSYGSHSPEERAKSVEKRILEIPPATSGQDVKALPGSVGGLSGAMIVVGNMPVFAIFDGDVDKASGETLEKVSGQAVARLGAFLDARAKQYRIPLLLRGLALILGATLVFLALMILLVRTTRRVLRWLDTGGDKAHPALNLAGVDLRPYVVGVEIGVLRMLSWVVGLTLCYVWLTFAFSQLPYTQPWGEQLSDFLLELFRDLAFGILNAIPNLFTVLVIFFLTHLFVRMINAFFRNAEIGGLEASWLQPETARATRRLAVVLTWMFAIVVAYPYIPGSQTEAFKGVSVFVGLMVSLGSAGLVSQIVGGLVIVYTRAFRSGEYVRIGEHEGTVQEIGVLSTKMVTRRKEEITIPNAVLVGTTTVNFSRLAGEGGAMISTSVTIGYDTPWRQVHAMLLLAAERTSGIRRDPRPFVQQRALSDWYAEYHLLAHIDRPEEKLPILSELHGTIQDVFNEFGVQIMSPHFVAQPDGVVMVPPEGWSPPPVKGV